MVATQPGQVFWLGWGNSNGVSTPTVGRSAQAPTYYGTTSLSAPIAWSGPYGPPYQSTGIDWMYRVYQAGGKGVTNFYGQGKNGTYGVPALDARGWPNLGNPLTFAAASLVDNSAGLLVLGGRVDIPLLIGSIYAFPPLASLGFVTPGGGKPAAQSWLLPISVPNDSGLLLLGVAGQIWILDPGAKDGLAHTAGVEFVIG